MALIEYNPPQEPWLDLVYRDDYIAVVNKPSGLLSVPGNQPQYYDSAMSRVKEKYGFCEPAHRLDMATSGILLFALSKAADRELKRQFREREPKKYYQALVWGHVEQDHGARTPDFRRQILRPSTSQGDVSPSMPTRRKPANPTSYQRGNHDLYGISGILNITIS